MRNNALRSLIACVVVVAAGCGGAQSSLPASSTQPDAIQANVHANPDAKNQDLIYVSDVANYVASVYSWSGKLLGTLSGLAEPFGMCTDEDGDVYIADYDAGVIQEYAHNGAVPIETLKDTGERPISCALDSKTGNLAVTNGESTSAGPGSVAIYINAKGKPKIYSDLELTKPFFCGYDPKGNLFLDGFNVAASTVVFAELPAHGTEIKKIKLNRKLQFPGGILWDGKYIDVGDSYVPAIYGVRVDRSKGTVERTTALDGAIMVYQYALAGTSVVAGDILTSPSDTGVMAFWSYPAGGNPTKTWGSLMEPFGLAISVPPPH